MLLRLTDPRTTDTQWRHKSKISEKLGWCGRQNLLRPYLKIWEWEWIFGRAVQAVSSLGVRSPWYGGSIHALRMYLLNFVERDFCLQLWLKPTRQIWHNSISTNYKWWQLWAIFSKPLWSYNALVFLLLKFHRIFLKNIYCLHACILWILFEIVNEWQKNWASSNSTSQSF